MFCFKIIAVAVAVAVPFAVANVVDVVLAIFFQRVCNDSVLKHQKLTTTAEAEKIKVAGK